MACFCLCFCGSCESALVREASMAFGGLLLIGLLSIDSLLLTSRYFKANSVKKLSVPNAVLDQLAQKQGVERVLCGSKWIYNNWLAVDSVYRNPLF